MGKIYLILASGDVFEGNSIGARAETVGEVVFTTAMTGYAGTICDSAFYGQIVVQTFPLIGNCGVIPAEIDKSGIGLKAYVIRQLCEVPSNFRCEGDFGTFLKENGIVGMEGVDTRRLTRVIREKGVMNGVISFSPELTEEQKKLLASYTVKGGVKAMSRSKASVMPAQGRCVAKVGVIDFGCAAGVSRDLAARGCEVHILPHKVSCEEVFAGGYDGIVLSSGAGDPREEKKSIELAGNLIAGIRPVLGLGLGHQLMALSQGAEVTKMKSGHRGGNQPVKDVKSGRIYITSQNHGYVVNADTLTAKAGKVTYVNANDGSCEGIGYKANKNAMSVQFSPESGVGPLDTQFILDNFVAKMEEK